MADSTHCVFMLALCVSYIPGPQYSVELLLTSYRTCASSIYTVTYPQLMKEFHCSEEVATLGLSFFVLGLAFGPMLLGPLSEVNYRAVSF